MQWRPQQLPDLIEKLRELVTCQYVEAARAICGRGDLMLVPALARHRLTVDVWRTMSPIQRQSISTCQPTDTRDFNRWAADRSHNYQCRKKVEAEKALSYNIETVSVTLS